MALDLSKLDKVKQKGEKIEARCPACFNDDGRDEAGNHLIIYPDGAFACTVHPGEKEHRRRIAELAGLPENLENRGKTTGYHKNGASGSHRTHSNSPSAMVTLTRTEEARYRYDDAEGCEVYTIVRNRLSNGKKEFLPFLPRIQKAGLGSCVRVPYRLPDLLSAPSPVWLVEGEKNADDLIALGLCATTRAGGSSTWEEELTPWFGGKDVILCGDNDAPGEKYMAMLESFLKPVAKSLRRVWVPKPHNDISDALVGLSDEDAKAFVSSLLVDPIVAALEAKRFDLNKPPVRTEPVLWISDAGVAKPGDLVVVQAQIKSGKSSFLAAMMGCLMGSGRSDCDFLGLRGDNPQGLPVIHIDTEQTPEDHYDMIVRTLKRAKIDSPPSWFRSYCLSSVSIDDRRKSLLFLAAQQPTLCAIFLDGTADLVHDVNDAAESNAFVDELFALAIRCRCPLISIIHENHGSDDGKQRGHLGSQLMRKAASNLRLTKNEDGVIQVWGEKLRRGHIPKNMGPHFVWDDDVGMHVTCDSVFEEKKRSELAVIQALLEQIFSGRGAIRYGELVALVMEAKKVKEKMAQRTVSKMLPFLSKSDFGYSKI